MIDREKALREAKEKSLQRLEEKDIAITHAVNLIDDLNEVINLLEERLTAWYLKGGRKKIKADRDIVSKVKQLDLANSEEAQQMVLLANEIENLENLKKNVQAYVTKTTKELMPNSSYLVGESLSAILLTKAGSLERLAQFPASTIQVLGAEKSLFKHLKKGTKPPKHGVIYNYPLINKAPRELRGKIARLIATKLAIAIKADYSTKRFIAEPLKKQVDEKLGMIYQSAKKKN